MNFLYYSGNKNPTKKNGNSFVYNMYGARFEYKYNDAELTIPVGNETEQQSRW